MAEANNRRPAAPVPTPETAPFWTAASEGTLLIKRCGACGDAHYYPRAICPYCFSTDTHWEAAKGQGRIYSVSVMRRGANAPYALAYVLLDEGPAILTNITDCDFDALAIGQRVAIRFSPTDGGPPVPMFTPVGD
ncbi:MAG: OB-fold domain-containing protein [Pseudomonadota bacterium]|nr:OB-fold domain-containing protein [Pseudomonadota bacterium]